MNLWDRIAQPWRVMFNRGMTVQDRPASGRIHVGRPVSGVHVTPDTALKNATVWACIQYLSKTPAQLPWRVMKEGTAGPERQKNHPVDWLLSQRPCPDMGSFNWRQAMLGNALTWGNAYAEIERDNRGATYALWPIHPERVAVHRGGDGGLLYEVWNRGGNSWLRASDMFHLRGFGDGPVGYNVIEYAAQSIGWAQATEIFGATYFGNGMNPTGVVEVPRETKLSVSAMDLLKASFLKMYGGPKAERTVFLDGGMKYTKVTTDPSDGQFIETRQHQVEEICRWFGVPPHKVMHLLRATFSNIEHQSIEVVVDSVTPWVRALEEEANYKLFGLNKLNLFTKIDLRGLLRGDAVSRAQYYQSMFGMGMTINQILALEDLPGIGANGDVPFVSNNVQTLENAIAGNDSVDLTDPRSIMKALERSLPHNSMN